jgi:hypothetical protein
MVPANMLTAVTAAADHQMSDFSFSLRKSILARTVGPGAYQSLIPLTIYDIMGGLQKYLLIRLRQLGRISGVDVN